MPNLSWNDGRSSTQALYHFDSDLTDASLFGRNLTGGAVSATQVKFGAKSLNLSTTATKSYVAGYNYKLTDQWTVDFWIYFSDPGTGSVLSMWQDMTATGYGIHLCWAESIRSVFVRYKTATSNFSSGNSFLGTVFDTWHHIDIVKTSSTVLKLFLNGTLRMTGDISDNPVTSTHNAIGAYYTGANFDNVTGSLPGYYDEFRISSTARWTATYTPPTAAYVY
jgi:hypothetical protein